MVESSGNLVVLGAVSKAFTSGNGEMKTYRRGDIAVLEFGIDFGEA